MSRYGGYDCDGWGDNGYGYGHGGGYSREEHEDITFFRPDGDTEGKSIAWCKSNGFFEISEGLWSGPWYYRLHPEEHPHVKRPHVCPIGGCRTRYGTEEELDRHLRTSGGKAHDKYRRSNGMKFGPTREEQNEVSRAVEERRIERIEEEYAELLDEMYGSCEFLPGRKEQIRKRLEEVEKERARIYGYPYEAKDSASKKKGKTTSPGKNKQWKEEQERRRLQQEARQKEQARLDAIEHKYRKDNADPPLHADEGSKSLEPDGSFEVTSGGICFGLRHNCAYAASLDPASFLEAQADHYNHKAPSGTWYAYHFVQRKSPEDPILNVDDVYPMYRDFPECKDEVGKPMMCAWFICHGDLDPVREVRRYLYEYFDPRDPVDEYPSDDGDYLHINRYDIGRFDTRGLKNADSIDVFDEDGCKLEEDGFHVIDWKKAKQARWKEGVGGMNVPAGCEGQQALIRYDEAGEARSLLFYDGSCIFTEYYFRGGTAPIGCFPWTPKCVADIDDT